MVINQFKVCKIPKGGCKFRSIYVPEIGYKRLLQSFLPDLHKIAIELDVLNVCHAFLIGRNCVTNAIQHIGYRYTVSLDIKDFFDSIRPIHLIDKIPDEILCYALIDGAPKQGLPTSPLISNIALSGVDNQINESLKLLNTSFAYTRYADDLTISFDDKKAVQKVIFTVRQILLKQGFIINEQKTRIQSSVNGRRVVTGIGVDNTGLYATRKTKRLIRAAIHQRNHASARGLFEWAQCKIPGQRNIKLPESYRSLASQKSVKCGYCGRDELLWYKQNNDRYILVHPENRSIHLCSSLPKPINRIELDLQLRQLGFKETKTLSKTWFKAMCGTSKHQTLLIMFRKRGIDLCLFGYRPDILANSSPLSLEFRDIYRLGYNSINYNIHELILKLAKQLSSGEPVDCKPLYSHELIPTIEYNKEIMDEFLGYWEE